MIVEILIGQIGCGKSTYAQKRAEEGWIIINDDAFVTALHGGNYRLYDPSLKPLYKSIESFLICFAAASGRNVVVDRTNPNKETRQRYISIAKSVGANPVGVAFPRYSSEEAARRRTAADDRGYSYEKWLEVSKRHDSLYEPPTLEEGFSLILDQ